MKLTNFKELTDKNKIEIPIIQRDYAQGREEEKIIREKFLENIFKHLKEDKEMRLDLVYGRQKNDTFLPLDGQQRLTTIFLLYWYFGRKEKKDKKDIEFLEKFTYETRASSREFCQELVKSDIEICESDELSKKIKNEKWFLYFNDPTVKSMLTMIDAIHDKGKNSNGYFEKLEKLKFQLILLEDFNLEDDLYIKMNARGKKLTDFEIFKAEFEKFLEEKDKARKEKFTEKIDTEWTDLFWKLGFKKDDLIDEPFMNYFYFISEMLYFKTEAKTEKDFENMKKNISGLIKEIYFKDESIEFFFKAIENLERINEFNEKYFSKDFEKDKLVLFNKDLNLLKKLIIEGDLNLQQKILLYAIINGKKDGMDKMNLLDKLRILRNLTQRIRQLPQGKPYYDLNLSYENLHYILKLSLIDTKENVYDHLKNDENNLSKTDITQDSLNQEIVKAQIMKDDKDLKHAIWRLEDYKYIRGDLSYFLFEDKELLKFTSEHIAEIFESETHLIIRSLLTIGDYKPWQWLGRASSGDKYFFGTEGKWEILLTHSPHSYHEKLIVLFREFFKKYKDTKDEYPNYKPDEILEKLILNYLEKNSIDDGWCYYFIKYGEKIFKQEGGKDINLFVCYDRDFKDDFNIDKMYDTYMSMSDTSKNYVNVYIKILSSVIKDAELINNERIKIDNKIISCDKEGWKIKFGSDKDIPDFCLKHDKSKDIIETAKEWIEKNKSGADERT